MARGRSRWVLWLLAGLALLGFGLTFAGFLFLRSLRATPAAIGPGTTLVMRLTGAVPEETRYELRGPLFGIDQPTVRELVAALRASEEDDRIDEVFLRLSGASMGTAKVEEIGRALERVRASGKRVVAYIEQGGTVDYLLASFADRIYLHPQSVLDLRGLRVEVSFFKGTLDLLGVEAEIERIGPYKTAPEAYTREGMSPAHRESLEAVVDALYERIVEAIATGRQLAPGRVRALLDEGPFTARRAEEAGLVDGLRYLDEVEDELAQEGPYREIAAGEYRPGRGGLGLRSSRRIAVIYGVGAIASGRSDEDALFGVTMGAETIAEAFDTAREDEGIEAVVFRIDSPGGSDVASDVIWRAAARTKEEKPVVVSMSDVAASGGYWIATASDAIVAQPTTITGSIGIYAGKLNLAGLYEKLGIRIESVERGRSAGFWSDARSFTPEERERLRAILREGYRRFLEKVAAARGKTVDEVDAVAQGRIWTGQQAVAIGLVDELGGLDRALDLAREKAGIGADERVELVVLPRKKSFVELLLAEMTGVGGPVGVGRLLDGEDLLDRSPLLRAVLAGERLAMLPFRLRVR